MPGNRTREFLDSHYVKYITISHSPAFMAQEIAVSARLPGRELAKTEIVFNAGNHSELIRIAYQDYERLVRPTVAKIYS